MNGVPLSRDEYAQAAMVAVMLCNCPSPESMDALRAAAERAGRTVAEQIAVAAFEQADAMVAEAMKAR